MDSLHSHFIGFVTQPESSALKYGWELVDTHGVQNTPDSILVWMLGVLI